MAKRSSNRASVEQLEATLAKYGAQMDPRQRMQYQNALAYARANPSRATGAPGPGDVPRVTGRGGTQRTSVEGKRNYRPSRQQLNREAQDMVNGMPSPYQPIGGNASVFGREGLPLEGQRQVERLQRAAEIQAPEASLDDGQSLGGYRPSMPMPSQGDPTVANPGSTSAGTTGEDPAAFGGGTPLIETQRDRIQQWTPSRPFVPTPNGGFPPIQPIPPYPPRNANPAFDKYGDNPPVASAEDMNQFSQQAFFNMPAADTREVYGGDTFAPINPYQRQDPYGLRPAKPTPFTVEESMREGFFAGGDAAGNQPQSSSRPQSGMPSNVPGAPPQAEDGSEGDLAASEEEVSAELENPEQVKGGPNESASGGAPSGVPGSPAQSVVGVPVGSSQGMPGVPGAPSQGMPGVPGAPWQGMPGMGGAAAGVSAIPGAPAPGMPGQSAQAYPGNFQVPGAPGGTPMGQLLSQMGNGGLPQSTQPDQGAMPPPEYNPQSYARPTAGFIPGSQSPGLGQGTATGLGPPMGMGSGDGYGQVPTPDQWMSPEQQQGARDFLEGTFDQFQSAQDAANAANEARYNQGLDLLSGLNNQQNQMLGGLGQLYGQRADQYAQGAESVMNRYNDPFSFWASTSANVGRGWDALNQDVMGRTGLMGQTEAENIRQRFGQQQAQAEQDLINRGLGNTTVRSAVNRGIAYDQSRAQTGLAEDVANQMNQLDIGTRMPMLQFGANASQFGAGLLGNTAQAAERAIGNIADLQGQGLQFGERANQAQQGIGQSTLGWIGARNDTGPDYNTMAGLASQIASGGVGWGNIPSLPSPTTATRPQSPSLPYMPPQQQARPASPLTPATRPMARPQAPARQQPWATIL